MKVRELRTTCPACGGELVRTRHGAVCMNAALGKCDRSRVLPYATVVHPNQHTYAARFPMARWSQKRRRWICEKRAWRRVTSRRVIDAFCSGEKIARTDCGRLIVLTPAKRSAK